MEKKQSEGLQEKSQLSTQIYESEVLNASLILCFERLNIEPFNGDGMMADIKSQYPDMPIDHLTSAVKNGSMGKYGRTYRFSTQEVGIWISQYLKEKNPKQTMSNAFSKW